MEMHERKNIQLWLSAVLTLTGLLTLPSAYAQISAGSRWEPHELGTFIQWQERGDYTRAPRRIDRTQSDGVYDYNSAGNIERFVLRGRNVNRIEYRGSSYERGVYQFEGWFRVNDRATNDVTIAQTFHSVLLKWYAEDGGKLRFHTASRFEDTSAHRNEDIVFNARGRWVKINMIHDASNNRIWVYANDRLVINNQRTGDTNEDYYFKYGAYDASGDDDETVEWRDVRVFRRAG
jgi:hypothetical protein